MRLQYTHHGIYALRYIIILPRRASIPPMKLVKIYECLCDPTRLRILNLLKSGELCVCDVQEVLG